MEGLFTGMQMGAESTPPPRENWLATERNTLCPLIHSHSAYFPYQDLKNMLSSHPNVRSLISNQNVTIAKSIKIPYIIIKWPISLLLDTYIVKTI